MNKCLIVSMFSKQESSYAEYYKEMLKEQGMPYDILYFERYMDQYDRMDNEIVYSKYCPTGGSKAKKIGTMLEYMMFVRKTIRKGGYSSLIVLTTVPAVLIADILLRKNKGRYIIDIRDYTHEENPLYYNVVKRVIEGAHSVVLSSAAFKQFLPESNKYVVVHNVANNYVQREVSSIKGKDFYTIGFVGSIRYFPENSELIRQIQDRECYRLDYYGTTTQGCDFEGFCKSINAQRVTFHGKYENAEKNKIYENIDIINAIYGVAGLETTTAIPNRFYDAAIYKCPIIVSKGTYLETIVKKYHIGIAVDIHNENVPDAIDQYLKTFDEKIFIQGCNELLKQVSADMQHYRKNVKNFIRQIGDGREE